MRTIIASAVVMMLGVANVWADDSDKRTLADQIHKSAMERYSEYRQTHRTKAMAICIQWNSPTPPRIQILGAFATRTGITSDRPIFPPVLRRDALRRCKGWAAAEKADCACQALDENGKNVLRVP